MSWRHAHVDDRQVGAGLLNGLEQRPSVTGAGADFDVVLGGQPGDPLPEQTLSSAITARTAAPPLPGSVRLAGW
jgi:hypothetical protein